MPYILLGKPYELQLQVPTRGTTNWEEIMREQCFQKIVEHDHTGSGKGSPIYEAALAADSVTDEKRADFVSSGSKTLAAAGAATDTAIVSGLSSGDVVKIEYSLTEAGQNYMSAGILRLSLDAAGNMALSNTNAHSSGGSTNLGITFTGDSGLLKYAHAASGDITMKYKVFTTI